MTYYCEVFCREKPGNSTSVVDAETTVYFPGYCKMFRFLSSLPTAHCSHLDVSVLPVHLSCCLRIVGSKPTKAGRARVSGGDIWFLRGAGAGSSPWWSWAEQLLHQKLTTEISPFPAMTFSLFNRKFLVPAASSVVQVVVWAKQSGSKALCSTLGFLFKVSAQCVGVSCKWQ